MTYDAHFYILVIIGAYFLLFGSIVKTDGFLSSILFKFIPLVSGFILGLMAFKVI